MDYVSRRLRLRLAMIERPVHGLLVTHLPNIRYLCGFSGSAGVLACRLGGARGGLQLSLFTDGRYKEQARREVQEARVVIAKGSPLDAAARWVLDRGPARVGIEGEHMSVASRDRLVTLYRGRGRHWVTAAGLVERLRMIKDPEELGLMRGAVQLGSSLFEPAVEVISPGTTEAEVAANLEYRARRAGAERMAFETIVAGGANSALPHWRASSQPIPNTGFVVLDFGVILSGYCSDMTRTVWVGKPDGEAREMYQAVLEAQAAGIAAVRPGATTGEVDQAARRVLQRAGLGKYFTHSTGHGVGLEIHEAPRLARGQTEVLQPGMVVTIEPGVYVPGKGGVRIEDMVAVTEAGHEVLTPTSKRFITV